MSRKLLTGLILATLIGGALLLYWQNRQPDSEERTNPTTDLTTEQRDQMNASDPTYGSDKTAPDKPSPDQPTSSKETATVVISQAEPEGELVVVRAYATVYQEGTCTATFVKGSESRKYTENTELQSSYTQCNPFQIPRDDFSAGTWKVTVVFESKNYRGEASQEITL